MSEKIKELIDKYQVRKNYEDKTKFINWLKPVIKEMNYDFKIDKYSSKGRNLIVGDINNAEVFLTAHYDTQVNYFVPMFMGMNWLGFIIGQLYVLFIILLPAILIDLIFKNIFYYNIPNIFLVLIVLLTFLYTQIGVSNKNTVNDNTSGLATLINIMENLEDTHKNKVCFVFFDQEEVGLIGSSKFQKKYRRNIRNKPLINFDCVANGNNIFFIGQKEFRNSILNNVLTNSVEKIMKDNIYGKKYVIGPAYRYIYPSDQLIYDNSLAVAALKKAPLIGYYLNGIHNSRDRVFMKENIALITEVILDFVKNI
ncbi:M28 family peptidase [Miniphocaeibacter halophilus]|uniref:M28 family peptidase n=1 Tax=Miniphocaeibacter halophilus TaxID=2931922 RepID=A0AC61MRA1_9FIRM|nr:M28 family peptidase [Miniphocaeibacter halophilus]QQK07858.1 M28 family peptidase [Miniphocaeibacter halophilus]